MIMLRQLHMLIYIKHMEKVLSDNVKRTDAERFISETKKLTESGDMSNAARKAGLESGIKEGRKEGGI